jgi:hypothetical protein
MLARDNPPNDWAGLLASASGPEATGRLRAIATDTNA